MSVQIATGSYVGDGLDGRAIPTPLSGDLRRSEIQMYDPAGGGTSGVWKNDALPSDAWLTYEGGAYAGYPGFTWSGTTMIIDGGGGGSFLNMIGKTYTWTALSE